MYLYHYYEKEIGTFCNLSDLSLEEAKMVLIEIKSKNNTLAAKRFDGYMELRIGKNKDESRSPFLYIEAQIWSNHVVKRYLIQ